MEPPVNESPYTAPPAVIVAPQVDSHVAFNERATRPVSVKLTTGLMLLIGGGTLVLAIVDFPVAVVVMKMAGMNIVNGLLCAVAAALMLASPRSPAAHSFGLVGLGMTALFLFVNCTRADSIVSAVAFGSMCLLLFSLLARYTFGTASRHYYRIGNERHAGTGLSKTR